ncbi:hypothetical protein GCM10023319_74810 [Nocardia iowensis]
MPAVCDPDHAQIIRRYATWHLLSQLRGTAERTSLTTPARRHAHDQVKQATLFLEWLAGQGVTLAASSQSSIDAWHAQNGSHCRRCLRTFLLWCMVAVPTVADLTDTALAQACHSH